MATIKVNIVMVVAKVVIAFNYEPYPCPSLQQLRGKVVLGLAFEVKTRAEPLLALALQN